MAAELPDLCRQLRPCFVEPLGFMIAWSGVLALRFKGFPSQLIALKELIDRSFGGLCPEGSGSKFPKATLGALRAGKRLDPEQLQKLQGLCAAASARLAAASLRLEVSALSLVAYEKPRPGAALRHAAFTAWHRDLGAGPCAASRRAAESQRGRVRGDLGFGLLGPCHQGRKPRTPLPRPCAGDDLGLGLRQAVRNRGHRCSAAGADRLRARGRSCSPGVVQLLRARRTTHDRAGRKELKPLRRLAFASKRAGPPLCRNCLGFWDDALAKARPLSAAVCVCLWAFGGYPVFVASHPFLLCSEKHFTSCLLLILLLLRLGRPKAREVAGRSEAG